MPSNTYSRTAVGGPYRPWDSRGARTMLAKNMTPQDYAEQFVNRVFVKAQPRANQIQTSRSSSGGEDYPSQASPRANKPGFSNRDTTRRRPRQTQLADYYTRR